MSTSAPLSAGSYPYLASLNAAQLEGGLLITVRIDS